MSQQHNGLTNPPLTITLPPPPLSLSLLCYLWIEGAFGRAI
jgi:hypothetical protein